MDNNHTRARQAFFFRGGLLILILGLFFWTGCSNQLLREAPHPQEQWACDKEADEAMLREEYEVSIVLHYKFLGNDPQNALALYHLGYGYGQIGDHLNEVVYYEKAVKQGFRSGTLFFNMGMAYGELQEPDKAVAAFKTALEIDPENADNFYGLGMAYQMSTDDRLAEEAFLRAIEIESDHVDARLTLSSLYADWGELQKAAEQLRNVLEIDPDNERALQFLKQIERE